MINNFLTYFLFCVVIILTLLIQWLKFRTGTTAKRGTIVAATTTTTTTSTHDNFLLVDCFQGNVFCMDDGNCSDKCLNRRIDWVCKLNTCVLKEAAAAIPKCKSSNGHLQTVYDETSKKFVVRCVCNNLYYYGDDCSKVRYKCDYFGKDGKCICPYDLLPYQWRLSYDDDQPPLTVCVDSKYQDIYDHQPFFHKTKR